MKKIVCVVIACLLVFCFGATSFAKAEGFEIPDLHMTVVVPGEDMVVGVPGVVYNDAMLQWLDEQGVTEEEFESYAKQNMLYFTAMSADGTYEYSISSMKSDEAEYIYDLDTLSDQDIKELMKASSQISSLDDLDQNALNEVAANGGLVADNANINMDSVEKVNGVTYIRGAMDGSMAGMDLWQEMYSTVKNGMFIYIKLINYDGPATQEQKEELAQIVQSASYEEIPSMGKTYAQQSSGAFAVRIIGWVVIGAVVGAVAAIAGTAKKRRQRKEEQRMAAMSQANGYAQPQQGGYVPPQQDGYAPPAVQGGPQQPQQNPAGQQPVFQQPVQQKSKEELIAELADLQAKGVLTQAEFEQKKREIEQQNGGFQG